MGWVRSLSPSELAELIANPDNVEKIPEEDLDFVLAALGIDADASLQKIRELVERARTKKRHARL